MRQALLDTDILSEILKRKDAVVLANAQRYIQTFQQFTLSAVSVHEVIYGLHSKGALRQLQSALEVFMENEIVVPDLEDFQVAGEIRGKARQQGKSLALDDFLIGTIASRRGLVLVTGNVSHFDDMRQAGLEVDIQNWRND